MAKRRRFSRWRRLPGVYRFGDEKPSDPHQEPQRLTLYLSGTVLDLADMQALRLGFPDAQEYCTELLLRAIEAEHVREHMADVESKRGPLEGLHEIAEDTEYLAELRAAGSVRTRPGAVPAAPPADGTPETLVPIDVDRREAVSGITFVDAPEPLVPVVVNAPPTPPTCPAVPEPPPAAPVGRAVEVVLRHAGQAGDDPFAFLPCLRRGESVPPAEVADLAQALHELERDCRGARSLDRTLTFALHRLAFESQILQTDAWPGAFDVWSVDMVRAVQEAVERILSGQDIRYYGTPGDGPAPADPTRPHPEPPR